MPRRSLLLTEPRQLSWVEEDFPPLAPDHVVVQTIAGAISIGSELPQYLGNSRGYQDAHYPRMTGYESLGTVVARGKAVQQLRVGDRVLGFYGHRTHGILASNKVIAVPPQVPDPLALLAILSCDAAKGVRRVLGPEPDPAALAGPFLVTGGGTMGLLTVFVLDAIGAQRVDVVEPLPARQELATSLGAREIFTPDRTPDAEAYAAAFECSSRNTAFALAQHALRPGAPMCVIADGNLEPLVLTPDFHCKELRIIASSNGWDYIAHAAWYFDYLSQHSTNLAALFDHTVPARDLAATFEHLATGEIAPVKVFVSY